MVDPQGKPGSSHSNVDSSSSHDNLEFWTDASKTGWWGGRVLVQHHSQRPLDPGRSSPPHQLPGVSGCHPFPLGSLPPRYSVILIRSDNTVVVSLINKQGSDKSRTLSHLLQDLLSPCKLHSWTLRARYLPGHLNAWVDSLSRNHPIKAEWSLSQHSFQQLTAREAKPQTSSSIQGTQNFRPSAAPTRSQRRLSWMPWQQTGTSGRGFTSFPLQTSSKPAEAWSLHFEGTALIVAPSLPFAPWWPEFLEALLLLEEDLDVRQWVQGEWLHAREMTSFLFHAYSFCKGSMR